MGSRGMRRLRESARSCSSTRVTGGRCPRHGNGRSREHHARADFSERPALLRWREGAALAGPVDGARSSLSREGSFASSRSKRLMGTLTACLPDSYFWKALGPPPRTSPALRWLSPNVSRTLATSLGPSTPSTVALRASHPAKVDGTRPQLTAGATQARERHGVPPPPSLLQAGSYPPAQAFCSRGVALARSSLVPFPARRVSARIPHAAALPRSQLD
jgi:hypothetical protein